MYDMAYLNNVIGMPNKIFEAMACGKPVIVSKHSMAANTVAKHNCGISVEYGDKEETYMAMKRLTDPILRDEIGNNGRIAYQLLYSWRAQENDYLRFVESIGKSP
jgi:glycosyltransferase involved in cell wall biosynthesis